MVMLLNIFSSFVGPDKIGYFCPVSEAVPT